MAAREFQRRFVHESSPAEEKARAETDVTKIVFTFVEDGDVRTLDLAEMFGGKLPPPGVGRAAAAFGFNTAIGNACNTATGEDGKSTSATLSDMKEAVDRRLELFADGKWSAERAEFGPRTSLMMEAILAYRTQKGLDVSEGRMAKFKAALESDDSARKRFLKDDDFRAVYEEVRAEKQLAAAQAAKEAASKAKASGTSAPSELADA